MIFTKVVHGIIINTFMHQVIEGYSLWNVDIFIRYEVVGMHGIMSSNSSSHRLKSIAVLYELA